MKTRDPATVGPIDAIVEVPPAMLFQMLGAIGQPRRTKGERSIVLERHADHMVCDFWTLVPLPIGGGRLVRTREEVRVEPPDTVRYLHLDGLLRGLREEIVVETLAPPRARLRYRATYLPGTLRNKLGFVIMRPFLERTMRAHFADVRARAEARDDGTSRSSSATRSGCVRLRRAVTTRYGFRTRPAG